MAEGQRFQAEPLRSLAFGAIGVNYAPIGLALSHPSRLMLIQNLTDATLMFSIDGLLDHFVLPANGYIVNDITANKVTDDGFFLAVGQRLYVKQIGVPTSGAVYFSVFHGQR